MVRIELEKSRETFQKERKLLSLRINELEAQLEEIDVKQKTEEPINLQAKLKRLEEENFRLSQLYQAGLHKIDYYSSLINAKVKSIIFYHCFYHFK